MADKTETELLAMLAKPAPVTAQKEQIAKDIAMQRMVLALATLINARLQYLDETIKSQDRKEREHG